MNKDTAVKLFEKLYEDRNNEDSKMVFYLMFVGLISSDTCIDEESCEESLDNLIILKSGLEEANIPEDFKEEFSEKIEMGIGIVQRDLNDIKSGNFGMC